MSILIKDTNIEDLQRAMLMFRGHEVMELPNKHGDLLDKDELSRLVGESFEYFLARLDLKCPKAIIPAEEEIDKWWERNETVNVMAKLRAYESGKRSAEPKRGKWEDVEADEGEWICFKCSECGHDAYSYTGEILSNLWKFCPYCGAKMEGIEDEET